MMDVFLQHLPSSYTLHTSKRLARYTEAAAGSTAGAPVTLHFLDGTTAEADVLVGADGIHSATRACMYADAHLECMSSSIEAVPAYEQCTRCSAAMPKWSGVCSYRCLIPTERLYRLNPSHTTASIGTILCVSVALLIVETPVSLHLCPCSIQGRITYAPPAPPHNGQTDKNCRSLSTS